MKSKRWVKMTALFLVLSVLLAGCASGAGTSADKTATTAGVSTSASTTTTTIEAATTTTEPTTTATTTTVTTDEYGNVITTNDPFATITTTTTGVVEPTIPVVQGDSGAAGRVVELTESVTPRVVSGKDATESRFKTAYAEFAIDLLQGAMKASGGANTVISPLSVYSSLSMVANGASGTTKTEMEQAMGGISVADLNKYLYDFVAGMPVNEWMTFEVANSIWIDKKQNVSVPKSFLQTAADYYEAQVFKDTFDKNTAGNINNWISERTDGLVNKLLDSDDTAGAAMILLNTVLFEATWSSRFSTSDVADGVFVSASGQQRTVPMMSKREKMKYIVMNNAVGFAKEYAGSKFSFVALMPNVGTSVEQFAQQLTAEKLQTAFNSAATTLKVTMPKFSIEQTLDLEELLTGMGVKTAFTAHANFSGLDSTGGMYLDKAMTGARIEVNENGTKAAAATHYSEIKSAQVVPVTLDRPFIYMITDNSTGLPLFIGSVTDIGK